MSPGDFPGTAREETAKAELKIRGLGEQKQRLTGEIASALPTATSSSCARTR